MTKNEKKNKCGKMKWLVFGSVLTIVGIVIIPPIIKKYGNKVYKKSLNSEEIDFDNMGPEIVPFDEEEKEKE